MPEYDALVYDLDGTLVHLAVDWGAVRNDVAGVLSDRGITVGDDTLWELLELADRTGHREAVEATIADHECEGARRSTRLSAAATMPGPEGPPVAVCSLNCEAACQIALDTHDLADRVDAVVGRDSVSGEKPDPGPLLAAVDALDATPSSTLFIGDSPRDEQTAERAGVPFRYVEHD